MTDLDTLLLDLEKRKVVTLSSSSTFAKTHALYVISQKLLDEEKDVWYFDLDLQYSSILRVMGLMKSEHLQLFYPKDEDLMSSFIRLVSSLPHDSDALGGMVVVDSINTLQLLLRERDYRTDSLKANHEASILISLLEKFATRRDLTLLLGNLRRPRPIAKANERYGESSWEEQLSGGRMIRQKSDAILSVSRGSESLVKEDASAFHLQFKVDSVSNRATSLMQGRTYSVEMNKILLGNDDIVAER